MLLGTLSGCSPVDMEIPVGSLALFHEWRQRRWISGLFFALPENPFDKQATGEALGRRTGCSVRIMASWIIVIFTVLAYFALGFGSPLFWVIFVVGFYIFHKINTKESE